MKIHLLELYRHPKYLPPYEGDQKLQTGDGNEINLVNWWINAKDEFKQSVLNNREGDEDIRAVCSVINILPDVTIFSHEYDIRCKKFTNPRVISNKDVKGSYLLQKSDDKAKYRDMVSSEWVDASHNKTPATIEEVQKSKGILDTIQLGFLLHKNNKRVFIGGRYNVTNDKYSYLSAVPTSNVKNIIKLERVK